MKRRSSWQKHLDTGGSASELDDYCGKLPRAVEPAALRPTRLALGVSATAVASSLRKHVGMADGDPGRLGADRRGARSGESQSGDPEPTEPVTITFASWVNETPMMNELRDRFQEVHPNITVEFQGVPAEEMDARLTTQIAGGNPRTRSSST